ncbi:hypothetical protein [Xanthobacter flavus]|uniref:hypothetical protein n=1 Tax=Xanthobacter flavus TaxID=281 RepID=UPI00372B12A5
MADKKFTLFHLSLIERSQHGMFDFQGTREEWLRFVLRDRFMFQHRSGELHWVPQGEDGESIVGLIQRSIKHARHDPPELGGAEVVADEWQGAYVVIDPSHHDDGQKAAVENDYKAGKPAALINSLAGAINARDDAHYHIAVEPLFDANQFWQFSADHGHVLRWINFDFVVPNMWGTRSDLDKDLRDTGRQTGAQRVSVRLRGSDGVSTQNDKVREGVEYVERGAGKLTAKSLDGQPYNSDDTVKTTGVPAPDGTPDEKRGYFSRMRDRILGREKVNPLDRSDGLNGGADNN